MSRFEVFLKPSALKDLRALDPNSLAPIQEKIRSLAEEPLPTDVKKLSSQDQLFRIRQGKHRIVYSIDFQAHIVRVLAVDHRKDIY